MRSIKKDVTFHLAVWVTLVFILSGLIIFLVVSHVLTRSFNLELVAKARALISVTEFEDGELEIDLESSAISGGLEKPDHYQIFDVDGVTHYRSRTLNERNLLSATPFPESNTYLESEFRDDGPYRLGLVWFRPIDDNTGLPTARYLLVVGSSSSGLKRSITSIGLVVLITSLVALAATTPIVISSLRRGLKPVSLLAAEAASLGPNDLAHRFITDSLPEEILPVAQKLNNLLSRLDESFERERRFSSNASHELRNPLAEIRTIAEMAIKWPEEVTKENFDQVLAIAIDMQKLVEHLVMLARTDSGHQKVLRQSFDFATLISESIARREADARLARIEISSITEPGAALSDPIIWGLIVGNLLDNAIRYSQEGSTVKIIASPGSIEVSNPAPQLNADDIRNFTERFWRKDDSHQSYGHSGLGLALVQGLTESLGAEFEAEFEPESGVVFVRVKETWKEHSPG